jgi:hypothetical protein
MGQTSPPMQWSRPLLRIWTKDGWPRAPSTLRAQHPTVDSSTEWATLSELSGAWISLTWPDLQKINRIVLYDGPNEEGQVLAATLHFSDGSTIPIGLHSDNGAATAISFPAKITNKVVLVVDSARGSSTPALPRSRFSLTRCSCPPIVRNRTQRQFPEQTR